MDPNLVRQLEPKTLKNRICGSNFRNPQLHCGKAAAAQAVPTNWRGTDLGQPVFGAKVDLLLGLNAYVFEHAIFTLLLHKKNI